MNKRLDKTASSKNVREWFAQLVDLKKFHNIHTAFIYGKHLNFLNNLISATLNQVHIRIFLGGGETGSMYVQS